MSENPWVDLPQEFPRVLDIDSKIINSFNNKNENVENEKYKFQTHLLPEPFFGDKDASIYLLALNPGYDEMNDNGWHECPTFTKAITDTQQHKNQNYPFYYFDPRFEQSPGAIWWKRICSSLIENVGIENLAKGLFCAELFPYHSKAFKTIPKKHSETGLVPSCDYTFSLIKKAIEDKKIIIVMRSYKLWCQAIPELEGNCFIVKNPRNPSLTTKNLTPITYESIVKKLTDL